MNPDNENKDLFLLLGRLEGKVDALTVVYTNTEQRLQGVKQRLAEVETSVAKIEASLEAEDKTKQSWISNVMAFVAVAIAAASAYFQSGP